MSGNNWVDYDDDGKDELIFTGRRRDKGDGGFPDLLNTLKIIDESEQDQSETGSSLDTSETYDSSISDLSDEGESEESIEPYDMNALPQHACKYCGIHDPCAVAKCNGCSKWFCNGKGSNPAGGSHLVQHLVRAKHREVSLHPESAVGDATLECYNCGNKNIFLLGFIPAKADTVVVLLCRQPCAGGGGSSKDSTWDLESWKPLISERAILSWLVRFPSEIENLRSRPITGEQIIKLEECWKTRPEADLIDLVVVNSVEESIDRVQTQYESAFHYQSVMTPLVKLEAEQDRDVKEAQKRESITIRWDIGLNMKRIAWFYLPLNSDADFRVAPGDEVQVSHPATKWKALGYIIRSASNMSEEVAAEFTNIRNVPSDTSGYTVEFVWKSVTYDRMLHALRTLAHNDRCLEPAVLNHLLGHETDSPDLPISLPRSISAPGLPELNHSQAHAVRSVLLKPLSLIQGPPGTGKTVTCATLIYHLAKMNQGPILVCAPSNVAVDHLTEKIHATGLRVVRIAAKWREDIDSSVSFLSLHSQLKDIEHIPELRKLIQLKEELGELSAKDENQYLKLKRRAEKELLKAAQVICTTAIGAGDGRLHGFKFRAVLLDEATQATEPEALIPLVHGARQVVLVGDHRQLGPVILNKKAVKAGFNQSLFERLMLLGLRPVRLQVQYRMHPCLSEFPSNMFYDGSLQNGVTLGDRVRSEVDFPWPSIDCPMLFLCSLGTEEISSSGTSFLNRVEAANCEKIVTRFLKSAVLPTQIGVITPYDGQRAYIQNYMHSNGTLRKELYSEVEVASVDAFQGREKDYIILSCVRSNDTQTIGFLSDARRLNVALTRAKYGLVILGNPRALSRNLLWNHLLIHFKEKGLLMEGSLGNLRPSLLQIPRPRPYFAREFIKPNTIGSFNSGNLSFPLGTSIGLNSGTMSQSAFDTISLSGMSQVTQTFYDFRGMNLPSNPGHDN